MDVDVGRVDVFVSEPQRDDGGVDPGVQQSHGGGVAQRVRGDVHRVGGADCARIRDPAVSAGATAAAGGRTVNAGAYHGGSADAFLTLWYAPW